MSKEPKHVRYYFPPQPFYIIGTEDGKTDGQRIREAYGSQSRQTPAKIVFNSSGNPSNLKLIFEQNNNGEWEVEFQGLKPYVEQLIQTALSEVIQRIAKLEQIDDDAFRMTEDILKKSWSPTNRFVKDTIATTVKERFEVKEKPKRRTKEALSLTEMTANEIDKLDALTDEEKEELKRERLRKLVLE